MTLELPSSLVFYDPVIFKVPAFQAHLLQSLGTAPGPGHLASLFTAGLQLHLPMGLQLPGKELTYDEGMKKSREDVNRWSWSPNGTWGLVGWSSR